MKRPALLGSTAALVVVIAAVVITIPLLANDSDSDEPPATATATPATTSPAETASPTAASATATPGGDGVVVPTDIDFEDAFPNLPDLDRPIAMLQLPGSPAWMLVALQDGVVVAFPKDDPRELTTVLDQRDRTGRGGNEEGLLGMVLDAEFEENGFIYLYYNVEPGERRTQLSRFELSGNRENLRIDPASELPLLTVPQPFSNHNGGQLAFGPDGMLYLALGDGGSGGDPNGNGQDLTRNLLGSILRLDVRGATADQPYRIPPDNPFADGPGGARPETYAYGLRNPWRFNFDRETGDMWAGDVGQGEREEIDIIRAGGNYGWNIMEGFQCFRPSSGCDKDGLIQPVADYGHEAGNCSVTGGFVYRGEAIPALRGVYLYADFCSGAMWGLPAADAIAGNAVQPVQWRDEGPPISTFAEDADGELYMLAFDGRIYRVTGAGGTGD
ncbi:MAG: PQQ-dependent sugar dehydrogenase [Hyphomicrobiales bacterium]